MTRYFFPNDKPRVRPDLHEQSRDKGGRIRMGDALCDLGNKLGLTNEVLSLFDKLIVKKSAEPMEL